MAGSISKKIAQALLELMNEGKDTAELSRDLSVFLERYKLELLLPDIVRALERERGRLHRDEALQVQSVHHLSKEQLEEIAHKLGVPKTAYIENVIKEDLLGGFIARFHGRRYDGSVRGSMERLRNALLSS